MSTGRKARMATMCIRMRKKKDSKAIIDLCQMGRTVGIVGLIWEAVMAMGMSASMATMQMQMRSNMHLKLIMDQLTMWRPEGIILESVKIALNISYR
jgi:hypothetical protein